MKNKLAELNETNDNLNKAVNKVLRHMGTDTDLRVANVLLLDAMNGILAVLQAQDARLSELEANAQTT